MGLDPVLLALADCPVIEQKEKGGHIVFNPHAVISASDDLVLCHEICHKLAGRESYNKFSTACIARTNKYFSIVLNILLDWWDEKCQSTYSPYLATRIQKLKDQTSISGSLPDKVKELFYLYKYNQKPDDFPEVRGIEDLIVYADLFLSKSLNLEDLDYFSKDIKSCPGLEELAKEIGATPDLVDFNASSSNFYLKTVSKYNSIIDIVSSLWIKNKYKWEPSYFGEINWKNLPSLMLGEKIGLPIWRLFKKLNIVRKIYLVVDRSGSTFTFATPIMETAVIITESFRRCNVPVSILDVGPNNSVVNRIDEPLKFDWFVPSSNGGTPLGKVCSLIEDSGPDDYLLIITDGEPTESVPIGSKKDIYNQGWAFGFNELLQSLSRFKGNDLTFVIGPSFKKYYEQLGGRAISVEPTTIVRELINDSSLSK